MKIENLTIFILRLKHKLKVIFCYFAVSLKIPYSDGFLLVLQELVMLSLIKNLESDNYILYKTAVNITKNELQGHSLDINEAKNSLPNDINIKSNPN